MAYYGTANARYAPVRQLEPSDWDHADVFNATIKQVADNAEAIRAAIIRIKRISIMPSDWIDRSYKIENDRITEESLADIYFSNESKASVMDSEIDGVTITGAIVLTCETVPTSTITIDCVEIRNEVETDAG